MLTPENSVMLSFLICVAGAVIAIPLGGRKALAGWFSFTIIAITSALILSAVVRVLWQGPAHPVTYWSLDKLGFALRIYVDGLSAAFLGLIATIALCSSFYSIDYMRHYRDHSVRSYYPNLLLFIGAMYGIVCTTDTMFFFFVFWQLMTLSSYGLVRFEHRKSENVRAANKYLMMMQLACGLTMAGALLLSTTTAVVGGETLMKYDFDTISHYLPGLFRDKSVAVHAAFALFLMGFGIKVGMWPFGRVWLPDAHPAAPSPVSALLSGVMLKTGVYGLMRYFLWLVPESAYEYYPSEAWGMVIALLGTVTLCVGTAQAFKQDQTKRLLAFSSIGQMGYILLGLGATLALIRTPMLPLAALAFFGALFHTVNHGLFKSLLFLNAGSILYATGTQNMNQIGGLMRHMKLSAITALIASFSIAGVPLFNGFASKWSLFMATIPAGAAARYLPVCAVLGILTSALTLALVLKFFGACYLSRTSDLVAKHAVGGHSLEIGWRMLLPKLILALGCVGLGLFPMLAWNVTQMVLASSQQGLGAILILRSPFIDPEWAGLSLRSGGGMLIPAVLLALLAVTMLAADAVSRMGGAQARKVAPWLCGYARERDMHRYRAHNFYGEIKRYLRWFGGNAVRPQAAQEPSAQPLNKPTA